VNPPRRDVAMVTGWIAIAFQLNNPGAWLMHCHIVSTSVATVGFKANRSQAWHVSEGLAVQFLEGASQIAGKMDLTKIKDQCDAWDTWYDISPYKKPDSGL
jgi:laccase